MLLIDLPIRRAKDLNETPDKERDIFTAFAKRWHKYGKDAQSMVQVRAKAAVPDCLFQIAIGGRYQSHVDIDRFRTAKTLEATVLQHAQQLGLQFRWKFAYFIEEKASTHPPA